MTKEITFWAIVFVVLVVGGVTYIDYRITDAEGLIKGLGDDSAGKLYFDGMLNKTSITGVYMPGSGFWVSTNGRDIEKINRTVTHEAAHAYISQSGEKEHWCEG